MFQKLFQMGALAVLDIPAGVILSRNGSTQLLKGTFTDNYYSYNRGTGQFEEHTALGQPKDGAFQSTKTNSWNNGGANDRGFLSVEGGGEITKANPTADTDHIRASPPSGNAFTIQNTGATVFRGCGQNAGTSATNDMVISCWVRKADHSTVTSSDVRIHCGAASGDWTDAGQRAGATVYEPLRDGWTRIWARVATNGLTTTVAQGIKLKEGTTLHVEFGQHERYTTGYIGPTDPIVTDTASNTDRTRGAIALEVFLHGGTTASAHLPEGSVAVAISPDIGATDQIFGSIFQWGDTGDKHEISLSATGDCIQYAATVASSAVATITASNLGAYARHTAIGACAMWGTRGTAGEYFFAVNGAEEGSVVSTTSLPADDPARINVGGRLDGADAITSAANARIRLVAIFDKKLGRQGCCLVSEMMRQIARDFYPWS